MEILLFIQRVGGLALSFVRGVFFVLLLAAVIYLIVMAITNTILLVKHIQRRRKLDARIIRQAKAAGVWNTNAGGRALELYARERGLRRHAGESDAQLRLRIKEAVESGEPCHG